MFRRWPMRRLWRPFPSHGESESEVAIAFLFTAVDRTRPATRTTQRSGNRAVTARSPDEREFRAYECFYHGGMDIPHRKHAIRLDHGNRRRIKPCLRTLDEFGGNDAPFPYVNGWCWKQ